MAIEFKDGKYVDTNGHVTLDPTIYKDWQIAEEAEKALPPVEYFREKLGLSCGCRRRSARWRRSSPPR